MLLGCFLVVAFQTPLSGRFQIQLRIELVPDALKVNSTEGGEVLRSPAKSDRDRSALESMLATTHHPREDRARRDRGYPESD